MLRSLSAGLLMMLMLLPQAVFAEEEAVPANYVNYIELKPFVANTNDTEGQMHFVKCEISIQVSTPSAHHAVNMHKPSIRNDIVFLLTSKTKAELTGIESQTEIAKEALRIVQDVLVKEEGEAFVSDLFFTSFVVQ